KITTELFELLPDWAKLVVCSALILAVILLGVHNLMGRRALAAKQEELDNVKAERDDLDKRMKALDRIDTHVWLKPDILGQNQFKPARQRKTRFVALCNLKGGVG